MKRLEMAQISFLVIVSRKTTAERKAIEQCIEPWSGHHCVRSGQ
ncbi:hypothetical protein [Paenibacillus amylolyticus]|nr:hypothetical protein [Paenibacillus amylolyticus]